MSSNSDRPSFEEVTEFDINDRLEASLERFLAEAPIDDRAELLRFLPDDAATAWRLTNFDSIRFSRRLRSDANRVYPARGHPRRK